MKPFDEASAYAAGRRSVHEAFSWVRNPPPPVPAFTRIMDELARVAEEARRHLADGHRVVLMAGDKELLVFEPHPDARP